jgi:alkylated DNA repair dioxygenase AlkB
MQYHRFGRYVLTLDADVALLKGLYYSEAAVDRRKQVRTGLTCSPHYLYHDHEVSLVLPERRYSGRTTKEQSSATTRRYRKSDAQDVPRKQRITRQSRVNSKSWGYDERTVKLKSKRYPLISKWNALLLDITFAAHNTKSSSIR